MSSKHYLQAHADQAKMESVGDEFVKEGLLWARDKTIAIYHEIKDNLELGMNEKEAKALAMKIFADHGVKKHWHQPYVRFGKGTLLSFNNPIVEENIFTENEAVYIDLGPVLLEPNSGIEYEGDYGDTFLIGKNPEVEKCIKDLHELFEMARIFWAENKSSGIDIYKYLDGEVQKLGWDLGVEFEGHRIADFPHHRFSRESLALIPFSPADRIWVLELKIHDKHKRFGAFFEDILSI